MLRRHKKSKSKGQSMIEFVALILFVLVALLIFQKYIVRGISGQWKGAGDALGQGRIYDYHKTTECAFDDQHTLAWYNRRCYENNCEAVCLKAGGRSASQIAADCTPCITGCFTARCN